MTFAPMQRTIAAPYDLDMMIWFAGCGGDAQGSIAVPGVNIRFAANHWKLALESHQHNFPDAQHRQGDLHDVNVSDFPSCRLFWASPECPTWSQARGKEQDYARQPDLFGETLPDEAIERSRALMQDVPRYLEAMHLRGHEVLGGVIENVVDVRDWIHWDAFLRSIQTAGHGYNTRVIALNSMHARPKVTPWAPQSRDRGYVGYTSKLLGRVPDWDKWLRPPAWCPSCDQEVAAMQVFKKPGRDMGRYRQQYLYRCPHVSCRGQEVDPGALPALSVLDLSNLGQRIGDRDRPLAAKTQARIRAGIAKHAQPITAEVAGNTFERRPGVRTWPVTGPVTTQTASETKALAVPPMIVPAGGTWNDTAQPASMPFRARTTRENEALAVPPILLPLRSGRNRAMPVTDPTATVVADGSNHMLAVPPFITVNRGGADLRTVRADGALPTVTSTGGGHHFGFATPPGAMIMRNNGSKGDGGEHCTPYWEPVRTLTAKGHQSLVTWVQSILVPYYTNGVPRPVTEPVGTLSTRERFALATGADTIPIEDVLFRMLTPPEIGGAMAFHRTYVVLGNRREVIRQYGNAVTPCVAEVIVSAIVEAITGEEMERWPDYFPHEWANQFLTSGLSTT